MNVNSSSTVGSPAGAPRSRPAARRANRHERGAIPACWWPSARLYPARGELSGWRVVTTVAERQDPLGPRYLCHPPRVEDASRGRAIRAVPRGHGPLRDGHQRRHDLRRRPAGGHHRQCLLVRVAGAGAGDGRPRPAPVHHADGPAAGRYAVNILGADQQALSDCFAHAPGEPGPRGLLRGGVASPGRPACRSSTAPSPRSSAPSSRRSAPATTTCSSAASIPSSSVGEGVDAAPVLPPPLPAHRAGRRQPRRRQAGGLSADDPGERARHRL